MSHVLLFKPHKSDMQTIVVLWLVMDACVRVCVCGVCLWCVCVCVREREREMCLCGVCV